VVVWNRNKISLVTLKDQIFEIFSIYTMYYASLNLTISQKFKQEYMQHYYYYYFSFWHQFSTNWWKLDFFLENKSGRTTSISKGTQTKSLNLLENVKVNTANSLVNSFIISSNKIGLNIQTFILLVSKISGYNFIF